MKKAKKTRSKNEVEEDKLRYDPSRRQALPPTNSVVVDIPQFQYPKLNDVIISPREGQKFSISKLIEDSKPGTTINIPTGVYNESLLIDKPLKLIANGSVKLVSSGNEPVVRIISEGVSFRGFEFSHRISEADSSNAAIIIESGSALLLDCSIKSDACPAMCLQQESTVNANGCRFISKNAPNLY